MSNWNLNKPAPYQPVYQAGPVPSYGEPSYPMQPPPETYGSDQKNPYEGGRFAPKMRVHDPFFLVFFILQVSHV